MPQYPSYPNKNAANFPAPGFVDAQMAQFMAQRHGRFAAAALAGVIAMGANASAVTTSVALATTYVGLCLSNPKNSTKNLLLQRVGVSLPVAAAGGQSVGLIGGYDASTDVTHTTPATVRNAQVGLSNAAFVGKLDAAATLTGTPFWLRWLTGAPAVAGVNTQLFDIDGEIVIPPGGYVAIGTLIASGASGFLGSMSWEEVPAT